MQKITSNLGLVAGLLLAVVLCVPIYDLIWPHATDKHQGGPGFFLVLVLAPVFMVLGAVIGSVFGRRISRHH
jgi:hypothetical protein